MNFSESSKCIQTNRQTALFAFQDRGSIFYDAGPKLIRPGNSTFCIRNKQNSWLVSQEFGWAQFGWSFLVVEWSFSVDEFQYFFEGATQFIFLILSSTLENFRYSWNRSKIPRKQILELIPRRAKKSLAIYSVKYMYEQRMIKVWQFLNINYWLN